MNRRFLSSLDDLRYRRGAFATKWERWINPRDRAIPFGRRFNASHPSRCYEMPENMGCYAILYRTGAGSQYVVYIGYSNNLRRELINRIRNWDIEYAQYRFTCILISNASLAKEYEDDLIRYYCPTWNTRFTK